MVISWEAAKNLPPIKSLEPEPTLQEAPSYGASTEDLCLLAEELLELADTRPPARKANISQSLALAKFSVYAPCRA